MTNTRRKSGYSHPELMLSYQALREKEEEEKQTKNRYQALKDQYGRLTERAGELARQQEAAQERLRIAENNDMVKGMQESLDSLKRQIEEADREKKNWEDKLAQILKLKKKISALIKLLEADLPSLSSEKHLSGDTGTGGWGDGEEAGGV